MELRTLQKGICYKTSPSRWAPTGPELQTFAPHIKAFMPAEPPELGGVGAALHARGEGAALEALTAGVPRHKTRCRGARLNDAADRPGGERLAAERGQGASGLTCGGSQKRRNPRPSVNGAACSPSESARAGQSSERP